LVRTYSSTRLKLHRRPGTQKMGGLGDKKHLGREVIGEALGGRKGNDKRRENRVRVGEVWAGGE